MFVDRLLRELAWNSSSVILRTRGADDAGRLGKLVVALAVIERRQQLALGKVAGAAENDEIERIDGDDLACHGIVSRYA